MSTLECAYHNIFKSFFPFSNHDEEWMNLDHYESLVEMQSGSLRWLSKRIFFKDKIESRVTNENEQVRVYIVLINEIDLID